MNADERRTRILQLLCKDGCVSVKDLANVMNVSKMTVRRDLDELQQMGLIVRQYGGGRLVPGRGETEWPIELRRRDHSEEKKRIGRKAASLIQDGDVVIIDGGSTALEVAYNLTQSHLTVVTNSFPVMQELSRRHDIKLISIGGVLHVDNQTFIGPLALDGLRNINANVTILGTTCLSLIKGLTVRSFEEAAVQRAKIEAAERTILVMNSTKMHTHTLSTVALLEEIDTLVTDDNSSEEDRMTIESRGVKVIIAGSEPPVSTARSCP